MASKSQQGSSGRRRRPFVFDPFGSLLFVGKKGPPKSWVSKNGKMQVADSRTL